MRPGERDRESRSRASRTAPARRRTARTRADGEAQRAGWAAGSWTRLSTCSAGQRARPMPMQQPADVASGAWRKERVGERKERVTRASSPSTDRNGELSQLGESRPLLTHDAHEYEAAHAWGGMSAWPASGQHCSKQQCAGKKRWTQAGRSLGKQRAGREAISREEHGRSLLRSDLALARESRQRRVGQRTRATKSLFLCFAFC